MKTIYTLLILFIATSTLQAQEINWMTLEEAVAAQKKEPRKIIIDAYTSWCGPCKMLDKNTFHNPDVVAYINKNYYAVKFNAEGDEVIKYKGKTYSNPQYDPSKKNRRNSGHELSRAFGVRAFPTLIYLDENADIIAPIPGYQTPQQLELYLKMFKDNKHNEIKTQEDFNTYATNFKPTFKDPNAQ